MDETPQVFSCRCCIVGGGPAWRNLWPAPPNRSAATRAVIAPSSAIAATVSDPLFRSGRAFAAWLGVTPHRNSSGGKERLRRTSKRGHKYIRRGPFSNRVSFVNGFLSPPRVTVLSAVGVIRRNIWSEIQVLQCPQRAGIQ